MARNILTILIVATFCTVASTKMHAAEMPLQEALEQVQSTADANDVTIIVKGTTLRVCGAKDKVLEVITLTGATVQVVRIESNDQRVELNLQRGCYILKVGKVVRKISIR